MAAQRRQQPPERAEEHRALDRADQRLGPRAGRVVAHLRFSALEIYLGAAHAVRALESAADVGGAGAAQQPFDAQRGFRAFADLLYASNAGLGLDERSMGDETEHRC